MEKIMQLGLVSLGWQVCVVALSTGLFMGRQNQIAVKVCSPLQNHHQSNGAKEKQ